MANKELNVRVALKYDTYANWYEKNPVLLAGEAAIATVPSTINNETGDNGLPNNPPTVLIKVGDGTSTYRELSFISAKAADVLAACKSEATLRTFINSVITDAGVATDEALGILSSRVTTAENDIKKLNADASTDGSVAKKIADAIAEIRDDENIDSFADVVAELAKKQDTIPANTYDAYGAADQAYEDATGYFDAEMETIFSSFNKDIDDLTGDVRSLEEDVEEIETFIDLDGGLTDRINTAVNTEATRAKGVEKDLQDAIDAINDTEGGILKQAKDYADGKDAAIEAAQKAGDDAMAEAVKKVASVTAADKSVTISGTSTAPTIAAKLSADADNALTLAEDGLKVVIPDAAEYSIVKAADSGEYAAVYNLTKDGAIVGASINIPKDMVVKSGSVVGDEIILVLNDEANTEIKIAVGSLIEYVTSGSAAGDMVVITVDETTHKVTAEITDGTITTAKLSTALQTAIGKAHNHANADLLAEINADRFDAWDEAEQNAKDYADDLDEAMNERVEALEAIDHKHENKSILDGIEEADITAWDAKVDSVTEVAGSGLKATREGNAVTIGFDDSVTFIFNCGGAEIPDAE